VAQAACQPPALSRRAVAGLARRVRPLAGLEATTSPRRCRDGQCPLLGGSKPESSHQYKARRNRYALGRARRALAPRPALRATVARRLRSSRARPAVAQRPRGSSPDPDHLGSPETISDDQGAAFHQHFDPFGKPIAPASPELTRVGFTGHDHDNDLGLIDMKGRVYDPLAGRFMTADPVTQAPFWSQGLNRYSYVFNNPINNTDPSGFSADGDWSGVGATAWGGAVTGMAALSGFGVGAGAIAGGLGIGAMNPLGTALLGIGEGSAGSTHAGIAPTTAPKGSGGGGHTLAGAPGQIGPVGNNLPTGNGLQKYLRSRGIRDERTAMSTVCMFNPAACAAAMADTVATLLVEYHPFIEVVGEMIVASEAVPAAAMAAPLLVPGDSVQMVPPPKDLPGFPGTRRVTPKTPVQGGGGLRKRWVDENGGIYEWDSQHGAVERYDKRGKHLGEFDATTGEQIKPADPQRRVKP